MDKTKYLIYRITIVLCTGVFFSACQPEEKDKLDYLSGFEDRATITIENIADLYPRFSQGERPSGFNGKVSDYGKYNYPKILAVFSRYGIDAPESDVQNERLTLYKDLPTFHFNLVGLPRILYMFPEASGIRGNEIDFLRQVFDRDDSFNPWTCEGTENHVGMSRTAGYLYAQYALENYPEVFPEAQQRLHEMETWIRYFSQRIFTTGTGEFNSESYGTYNVIGWLNVYDFTNDPEIKKCARAVLDYYAAEIALHYTQGIASGSDMRGNRAITSLYGSQSYLGWLWFGDSPFPASVESIDKQWDAANSMIQIIHAALSNYRPPLETVELALKEKNIPAFYKNAKSCYLMQDTSYIKQTFYIDTNFSMGAGYFPYGGWSSGNWQIVDWKLVSRVEADSGKSAQFIAGQGMVEPSNSYMGNHRMPFDQLAHYNNTLVQLTRVPKNADSIKLAVKKRYENWHNNWKKDFYMRFPDDTDKENPVHFQNLPVHSNQSFLVLANQGFINFHYHDSLMLIELEKSVVVIRTINGHRPSNPSLDKKAGIWIIKTQAEKNNLCGFIVEVMNKKTDSLKNNMQVAHYFEIMKQAEILHNDGNQHITYRNSQGDTMDIKYQIKGSFQEPIYDWGYGPVNAGNIQQRMPYKQPAWPSGEGHGKVANVSINGIPLLDPTSKWPVYSGPKLLIENGRMLIHGSKSTYTVDYTSKPVEFHRKKIK